MKRSSSSEERDNIQSRKIIFNKDKRISSFKIDSSLEKFQNLLDGAFWSQVAFLREKVIKIPKNPRK